MAENVKKLWLVIALMLFGFACAGPRFNDPERIFIETCRLMQVDVPDSRPWIFVVEDGEAVFRSTQAFVWCAKDRDRACLLGVYVPPNIIFVSRQDLTPALLAHEYAHCLGADEREACFIANHFNKEK